MMRLASTMCMFQPTSLYQAQAKKPLQNFLKQCVDMLQGKPADPQVYPHQIAFNLIPQIGDITDNGFTEEEMKMHAETQKILGDDTLYVNATAVRVPVFMASESVFVQTQQPCDVDSVKAFIRTIAWYQAYGERNRLPNACTIDGSGEDDVFVGRIRRRFRARLWFTFLGCCR